MMWQWWAFFAAVVVAGAVGVGYGIDFFGDSAIPFGVACAAAVAATFFLIAGSVLSLGRHYGRVSCRTFAAQTHRQTRFVIYSSWSGGDCLTSDGHGHWIPTKNLREFGSTS